MFLEWKNRTSKLEVDITNFMSNSIILAYLLRWIKLLINSKIYPLRLKQIKFIFKVKHLDVHQLNKTKMITNLKVNSNLK